MTERDGGIRSAKGSITNLMESTLTPLPNCPKDGDHLKYECVYLHDFQDGHQARQTIGTWLRYYNEERPHSSHADDRTPMEEYARRRAA